MGEGWPLVPFADCMERVERRIILDDAAEYETVGVRWYGQGAFVRERQLGAQIARKQQWVIHEGDIVYNKLFAWKGAFAVADASVHGRIVSDKFPTYRPVPQLLDPRYLAWWFRAPAIAKQAESMSKGAAAISKLTLNPPQFWQLTIPLPPVEEQRRIVARVEAIAEKVEEARSARAEADAKSARVLGGAADHYYNSLCQESGTCSLNDLLEAGRGISYGIVLTGTEFVGGVPTVRAGDLRQFEVRTSGLKCVAPHIEEPYRRTRLRGNEVLLRIRGGYGEAAVCPRELIGANVSREIAVIPCGGALLPSFAAYMLFAPSVQDHLRSQLRGTSYVGINLSDVRRIPLPSICMEQQVRVVGQLDALRSQLEAMHKLRDDAVQALDALLPAVLDRAFRGEL